MDKINLPQARKEDLINYFIGTFNYSAAQANQATRMFLYLAQKANIKLSEELKVVKKSKKGRPIGSKNIISPRTREHTSANNEGILKDNNSDKDIFSKNNKLVIRVKGTDLSLDLTITDIEEVNPKLEVIKQLILQHLKKQKNT